MVNNKKCVEYYFDSKLYSKDDILEKLKETEKEYPNKKIEMEINLNEWGVYVVSLKFKDKKKQKVKIKNKPYQIESKNHEIKQNNKKLEKIQKKAKQQQIKFVKRQEVQEERKNKKLEKERIKKDKKVQEKLEKKNKIIQQEISVYVDNRKSRKVKQTILEKITNETKKIKENMEKASEQRKSEYYNSQRKYGQYKPTKTYKPY